jgi:hypothetical protein
MIAPTGSVAGRSGAPPDRSSFKGQFATGVTGRTRRSARCPDWPTAPIGPNAEGSGGPRDQSSFDGTSATGVDPGDDPQSASMTELADRPARAAGASPRPPALVGLAHNSRRPSCALALAGAPLPLPASIASTRKQPPPLARPARIARTPQRPPALVGLAHNSRRPSCALALAGAPPPLPASIASTRKQPPPLPRPARIARTPQRPPASIVSAPRASAAPRSAPLRRNGPPRPGRHPPRRLAAATSGRSRLRWPRWPRLAPAPWRHGRKVRGQCGFGSLRTLPGRSPP